MWELNGKQNRGGGCDLMEVEALCYQLDVPAFPAHELHAPSQVTLVPFTFQCGNHALILCLAVLQITVKLQMQSGGDSFAAALMHVRR